MSAVSLEEQKLTMPEQCTGQHNFCATGSFYIGTFSCELCHEPDNLINRGAYRCSDCPTIICTDCYPIQIGGYLEESNFEEIEEEGENFPLVLIFDAIDKNNNRYIDPFHLHQALIFSEYAYGLGEVLQMAKTVSSTGNYKLHFTDFAKLVKKFKLSIKILPETIPPRSRSRTSLKPCKSFSHWKMQSGKTPTASKITSFLATGQSSLKYLKKFAEMCSEVCTLTEHIQEGTKKCYFFSDTIEYEDVESNSHTMWTLEGIPGEIGTWTSQSCITGDTSSILDTFSIGSKRGTDFLPQIKDFVLSTENVEAFVIRSAPSTSSVFTGEQTLVEFYGNGYEFVEDENEDTKLYKRPGRPGIKSKSF